MVRLLRHRHGERRDPPRARARPRNFCESDTRHIERCLEEIPEQYVHLFAELGRPSARGSAVRMPFGPRVPIRVDVDALMKLMARVPVLLA